MTLTPPTPATPATPAPEKAMILTPQRKINKPRGEQVKAGTTPQPQKVASDETNWRTKSPNQAAGWDSWQSRREKGGPDRDKWKYIMPASLITTPIPDLAPPEEPDNKFSTPKKVPTLTPQRTVRRSLEQIQKAAASSPLCPPPPMPRSAYKASPAPKQKEKPEKAPHTVEKPVVEKEKMFDTKDLEQEPFDVSDFPEWDPDTDVNSLWDTLSASKESVIYDVRANRQSPALSAEEKVKRPLFTGEDDDSRPTTPRRNRSEGGEPESPQGLSSDNMITPLKKKSGSISEAKSARSNSKSLSRAEDLHPSRENVYENNNVINSPDFNSADSDNENEEEYKRSASPLPIRELTTDNTPTIADLSPISPVEPEVGGVQLSDHPSPLATRSVQPFPTFTIEEASVEGESPVSERKMSKTSSSASASPASPLASSAAPSDYASSECFAALASSNNSTSEAQISSPSSPASSSCISLSTSNSPVQNFASSSPAPAPPLQATPCSPPVSLGSSAPMQSQPPPSPVVNSSIQTAPRNVVTQARQQQSLASLIANVGGVNAFLIVFIAVLSAFLLADIF